MKTLIIHPKDSSTTFLNILYKDIENKTVLSEGRVDIIKEIENHDRIMMMGHGSPHGLFNTYTFQGINGHYLINEKTVPFLEGKECVFIWCNAHMFVQRFSSKLKGIYTGMFISEISEAYYCEIDSEYITEEKLNTSNLGFVNIFGKHVNKDLNTLYENLKKEYKLITENNQIAEYNHNRLYINTSEKKVVNEGFNKYLELTNS